ILSGAAAGIDGAAHRAAFELGLQTSAVLACGIDIRYPACHADLIDRIAESGGLLTELLPGTPPRRGFFPTRNRLLAALADAVLVVQAAEGSGSLITAAWAHKLARPVYALVPPDDTPAWQGNRLLLAAGGRPVREPADLAALFRECQVA
ncbi:MAG TPA: DNA-processing protein DprA, partial [Candidatus Ozemobacteraceae bacterium]